MFPLPPRHSNWSHVTLCFEHPPYRKPASGFFSHQSIGFSLQKNTVHKKCNPLKLSTQIMGSPVRLASLKFIFLTFMVNICPSPLQQNGSGCFPKPTKLHWATLGFPSFTALLWPDTTVWAGPLMALKSKPTQPTSHTATWRLIPKNHEKLVSIFQPKKKRLKQTQRFYPMPYILVGIQTTLNCLNFQPFSQVSLQQWPHSGLWAPCDTPNAPGPTRYRRERQSCTQTFIFIVVFQCFVKALFFEGPTIICRP